MNEPIKVFLVDDHPLVREGLTNLINQQPRFRVCGEAENVPDALRGIETSDPDVAIVDISLKGSSGLELIKQLKALRPRLAIIALSMHDEKFYAERAIRAGARGYVMKRESTKKIVAAIDEVLKGRLCISEQVAAGLAEKFIGGRTGNDWPVELLSDRELEVFNLLGQGFETRQVAETLNVSMKTVQAYCARIKQKLKLSTASELLREAIRWHEQEPQR